MGNDTIIARLGDGEVGGFRDLNALFAACFDDPETYGAEPPADAYLAALLRRDSIVALVARSRGRVVGGLVAYRLDKFERQRSEMYIYDLAVAESHRRRGIATNLIGHLCAIARDCGAWCVYVQADRGDDPAIALYSALGAREDVLHFDIVP